MILLLFSLVVWIFSGLVAWLLRRQSIGVGGALVASVAGLVLPFRVILSGQAVSLHLPWNVPFGSFSLHVDPLSSFFLVTILIVSACAALYGFEYLKPYKETKNLGAAWFFYNTLVASMMIVVCARNGVLFLTAWETMALSSFFLVIFEDDRPEVRDAGWSYMVASHLGTALLIVMFIALAHPDGSLDFDGIGALSAQKANLLFVLGVLGFGVKAGFFPLHVWLPEAHPAAPSHVSALMSGVMLKTGIYGIMRLYSMIGPGPVWWGHVLVGIGVTSGILGILFSLAQRDIKRLLAYSSVENIGIIALGLGVGMLGRAWNSPLVAALGFGGALIHVLNHSFFKSLLFMGAGAVVHATGTREIDRLGGLGKRMPVTAFLFVFGAAAISGLPPLNGFISEALILMGAYNGAMSLPASFTVPCILVLAGLASVSGLAVVCFTKAFGIVFLGEARSSCSEHAHDPHWPMRLPMLMLAAGCLLLSFGSPWFLQILRPVMAIMGGDPVAEYLSSAVQPVLGVVLVGGVLLLLIVFFAAVRAKLLSGRSLGSAVTWGCGYAVPSPRMQYSGSSFSQPLTVLFAPLLRTRTKFSIPSGFFPRSAEFVTKTPDMARERFFRPLFSGIQDLLSRLRWLQHGRLQLYILYVAAALFFLLLWKL